MVAAAWWGPRRRGGASGGRRAGVKRGAVRASVATHQWGGTLAYTPAMSASRPKSPVLLALTLGVLAALPTPAPAQGGPGARSSASGSATGSSEERAWTQPEAYHLGSYRSRMAGKITAEGELDTGFVQARVIDGEGEQVVFSPTHVLVARLKALGGAFRGDVGIGLSTLGINHRAGGDDRLLMPVVLRFENLGAETRELTMGVELRAGAGTGLDRPWGAVDFPGEAAFTRDDFAILRDGLLAMTWFGGEPESVELQTVDAPDAVGARVLWKVTLEPGSVRTVELKLAGPSTGDDPDHAAWRKSIDRQSMGLLEEELSWQSNYLGDAVSFYPADNLLRWCVLGGQMLIRSYGVANETFEWLSDRPFGHGPSDAAVPVELLAALFEWGQSVQGLDLLERLVDEGPAACEELSPERRLAYVHGLARCMRLRGEPHPRAEDLADMIEAYVREPLAVPPWNDPAHVRADLLEVFDDAGRSPPDDFPEFVWAEVTDPQSIEGRFLAQRIAQSTGEQAEAWRQLQGLLGTLAPQGYGSMQVGGVPSGRFAHAAMQVARETIVSDHGGVLEIFPGVDYGLLEVSVPSKGSVMPTRFGLTQSQMYYSGRRQIGAKFGWTKTREPESVYYHFIPSIESGRVGITEGGKIKKIDNNTFEVKQYGPFAPLGLRWFMNVDPKRAFD